MADHSELKRLAVELTAANDIFNESPQDNEIGDAWSLANDRFTEAASPEVILALIAENDGLKTGFEAYEQVNAGLKAEVEALRLALETCADELEGQVVQCYHGQQVEDMHPVTRRSYDRDMICVTEARAAMSKGEQS